SGEWTTPRLSLPYRSSSSDLVLATWFNVAPDSPVHRMGAKIAMGFRAYCSALEGEHPGVPEGTSGQLRARGTWLLPNSRITFHDDKGRGPYRGTSRGQLHV